MPAEVRFPDYPQLDAKRTRAGALGARECTHLAQKREQPPQFPTETNTLLIDAPQLGLVSEQTVFHQPSALRVHTSERVWLDLHANITRNHRCRSMEELMVQVVAFLRAYNQRKKLNPSLKLATVSGSRSVVWVMSGSKSHPRRFEVGGYAGVLLRWVGGGDDP